MQLPGLMRRIPELSQNDHQLTGSPLPEVHQHNIHQQHQQPDFHTLNSAITQSITMDNSWNISFAFNLYFLSITYPHQRYTARGPKNLKKSGPKKLMKSNKSISRKKKLNIFHENCIFDSFKNYFPSSKIDFWRFLKLQKNGIWSK